MAVPRDIGINKIAKTICKYCSKYQVGEYTEADTTPRPIINTMMKKPWQRNQSNKDSQQGSQNSEFNKRMPKDMSLKCQFCGQLGHDDKSDQGCMVFAKWTLCQQASQRVPPEEIKSNTRKFINSIRQRQTDARQRSQLNKTIRTLQQLDTKLDPEAIINSLQMFADDNDYDSSSDSDTSE